MTADGNLVAFSPAVAFSIALILVISLGGRFDWKRLAALPVLVYVAWYLAVYAAIKVSGYTDAFDGKGVLPSLVGGVVGAGLLSAALSAVLSDLRKVSTILGMAIVGGLATIPFVAILSLGDTGLGSNDWIYDLALFVPWQAFVAAALGHFLSRVPQGAFAMSA